jgi:hypothetical protein
VEITAQNATDNTLNCRRKSRGNKNLTHVEITAENATDNTLDCRRKSGGNKNLTHTEITAENATENTLNCRRKSAGNKNLTHPFIPTLCGVNCFDNFACRPEQAQPAAPTKNNLSNINTTLALKKLPYAPITAKTDGTRWATYIQM